ncbi:MAG: APC family permease [Clostridiales bacterium]|nr:APC family permease [Clostridiales bacterium]
MEKKLNLFDLISIGVGCIIGSGVFAMMGYGIAYTGRSITLALFLAMGLCLLQSIAFPLLTSVFELDGGEYAINSLVMPKMWAGFGVGRDIIFRAGSLAVTAIAVVQYLVRLFPGLEPFSKLAAIVVLTLAFLCAVGGDKFASRIQNIMCIFMYVALGLFVVYGILNIDTAAYAGEPTFPNGMSGLVSAIALMSYTCNGFQYVVNMGKAAANPRRNIPLAFCLSAFVGAAIYGLIGFSATHAHAYSEIAGMNLGGIAEMMMPNGLYMFFIIGGALFALCTSLLGAVVSGYRPLMACAKDGWLPGVLSRTTKKGTPYVLVLLYLIGVIPILIGMDLGDVALICLFPGAITKLITNVCALSIPTHFEKSWKNSGMKISVTVYRLLLLISSVATIALGIFYFVSNDMKVPMIIVTAAIFAYSVLMSQFGNIHIQVKEEYTE